MVGFATRSFTAICLIATVVACRAQSIAPIKLNLDTDFHAQSVLGGRTVDGNYSGSLRLRSEFSQSWNVELYGRLNSLPVAQFPSARDFGLQQASIEKSWRTDRLQLGLVRLPFGIYDTQETYASGLVGYPLPRSDYGLTSVDWGVPGAKWSGGSPGLQFEAAGFAGRAAGIWGNYNDLGGGALRLQTYTGGAIVGVSHWEGYFTQPVRGYGGPVSQRTAVSISGIDLRFTRPHLLLRGELLAGAMGGKQMLGGYLDLYYHLPKFQRVTLVARAEELRPNPDEPAGRQLTLGVRYTAAPDWILSVNWSRNNFDRAYQDTWTPYSGKSGALLLQVYHKAPF